MCLALPGRIIERLDGLGGMPFARVQFGSIVRQVCLAYTPEAEVGDYVIVHVGFALQRLDEEAAERSLELLRSVEAGEEDS
ncbi:MAG: HypC/HybG/HupF family hydrogenase formation chaperone [Proteobacteria bacterium]|nr:HypC/HybG/HupF family hydrogenase formation chaperone [Pseudomonadota bacterium]